MNPTIDAILNPPARQDDFTRWLREQGAGTYLGAKRLEDGSYAVLMRLITTVAIGLGVDKVGPARRFCYRDTAEALANWQALRSRDDEPTGWIARRPEVPAIRGYEVYRDALKDDTKSGYAADRAIMDELEDDHA